MAGMQRPILLTGINGQVGGALLPLLQQISEVVAPGRGELDLSDPDAIREYVRKVQPRWIVNPAAYTAVDKAESERDAAFAINADAPSVLGEEAFRIGAGVIHFSTDYVFAGGGTTPWTEDHATGPLGVYGASKLKGEKGLAASGARHLIFRTSWVYGATGSNFLKTILRLARDRAEMKIVADQHGAPTWSRDLAKLTHHCITDTEAIAKEKNIAVSDALEPVSGVYHACGAGETTWFGFAEKFLELARQAEPEQAFAKLIPITTAEYPTPAVRPPNSRMNCEKLAKRLGFRMPDWEESVAKVMAELQEQAAAR